MKLVKTLQLNKLSSDTKEKIYKNLLTGKYRAELSFMNKQGNVHSIDVDFDNNDLCINSWSLNFYCRTPKAVKGERYKTLGGAIRALKKLSKTVLSLQPTSDLRIYNTDVIGWKHIHLFSIEL